MDSLCLCQVLTALAYKHFEEEGVDVAVMEVWLCSEIRCSVWSGWVFQFALSSVSVCLSLSRGSPQRLRRGRLRFQDLVELLQLKVVQKQIR